MSLPQTQLLFTPDEYLAFEREAAERHEWLDGLIYAMAGESPQHSIISANVIAILNLQLRGKPCRVFSPNMKVYSRLPTDTTMKGLFSYTDTLVVCGPPRFHDEHGDVVINPTVIVEVLSKSTEAYDRGEKFERYSQNASLTDYLLVSQHRPKIEHYTRREPGRWDYSLETSLAGSIYLAAIDCRLPLAEVYDGIEFPPPSEPVNPLETPGPSAG
jgi:Uma2 family endonuclease